MDTSTSPSPASDAKQGAAATFASDLKASLVVFLIAMPLSLGIALASKAPSVMNGLISAMIGGIVVGALSGAPLQVSGPAAGLVVIVVTMIEKFETWQAVCALTAMAGVLQIVFGVFRVARTALAISPAVIHGMLAGIGVVIALGQMHVLLGGEAQSSAIKNLKELPGQIADVHGVAMMLGLVTIAILFLWPFVPLKKLKTIPGALVAVVAGTAISLAWSATEVPRVSFSRAAVADVGSLTAVVSSSAVAAVSSSGGSGGFDALMGSLKAPIFPDKPIGDIIVAVLTIALIASVESLLCAVGTDKLHSGARANLDKELIAQGVGNTLAGMIGGMPITGVVVRSSANIQGGGKTRVSAMLHGVWILIFVVALGFVIEMIPKSVLAGLLVYTGVKLVNFHHIKELLKHKELPIYLVTLFSVVFIDLLRGVGLGFATSIGFLLWRLGRVKVTVTPVGEEIGVRVEGALSFLGVPKFLDAVAKVPPGKKVSMDLAVGFIDHAGWEALETWRSSHERTGGTVTMESLKDIWTAQTGPGAQAPTSAH